VNIDSGKDDAHHNGEIALALWELVGNRHDGYLSITLNWTLDSPLYLNATGLEFPV